MRAWLGAFGLVFAGCKPLVPADEALADALRGLLQRADGPEEAVATTLRNVERRVYATVDVGSPDVAARSVRAARLRPEDVAHLEPRPVDVDPGAAMTVTVNRLSAFDTTAHARVALVEDPAAEGLEPLVPDHYDRTFVSGRDGFISRQADRLVTVQELTRTVPLSPSLTYTLHKTWRWVDIAEAGEPERWAMIAWNWNPQSFATNSGDGVVHQSWGVEAWIPRDGRGSSPSDEADDGTLRVFTLWAESELGPALDETTEEGTVRWGTDRNLLAQERWLEEQEE